MKVCVLHFTTLGTQDFYACLAFFMLNSWPQAWVNLKYYKSALLSKYEHDSSQTISQVVLKVCLCDLAIVIYDRSHLSIAHSYLQYSQTHQMSWRFCFLISDVWVPMASLLYKHEDYQYTVKIGLFLDPVLWLPMLSLITRPYDVHTLPFHWHTQRYLSWIYHRQVVFLVLPNFICQDNKGRKTTFIRLQKKNLWPNLEWMNGRPQPKIHVEKSLMNDKSTLR